MFGQRRSDRRQGYSFLGHLQRVLRTKGAGNFLLSIGGTALIAGVAFAYCSKNSITGPAEPVPTASPSPITPSHSQSTVSGQKQAIAVFPTNLLPTIHPCDPTVAFTDMQGENDITYTDEILYNSDGTPSGDHQITYNSTEKQNGHDNKGNSYNHTKTPTGPQSFIITNNMKSGAPKEIVSHDMIPPLNASGDPQPCTTTFNSQSLNTAGGGPGCFDSGRTYDMVLVEDPITHEGTLAVTTVSITSTCPTTTISMRDP